MANFTASVELSDDDIFEATTDTLVITQQPQDQSVMEGDDATFSVVAEGDELSYIWFKDGSRINGATAAEYTVNNVIPGDSGTLYQVEVSDENNNQETSLEAELTVVSGPALSIITQPSDAIVDEGADVTFTVEAAGGSGGLNYQWYANGNVLSGETDSSLTLSGVAIEDDATEYHVVVSDNNVSVDSVTATLNVNADEPITDDGLVARWEMNESEGATSILDSSGNGHHGSIGNDVVTGVLEGGETVYRWLFTPPAGGHEPERIVNVPHAPEFNPDRDDYSITMRYRTNVPFGNIVQKGQGGAPGGYWKIENPGGYLTCVFRGVANNGKFNRREVVSSRPLNDDEYHTITCERIGSQLRLIVDGELDDIANNATGSILNDRPMSIGGKTNCDNVTISCDYFTGWIDEISISKP